MTDKYKYGSISLRNNVLDNARRVSTKFLEKNGEKISVPKTVELGIKALDEDLSNSERRSTGIANEKNQEA